MSYVNQNVPHLSSAPEKSVLLYSTDQGLDYATDSNLLDADKASRLTNFWLDDGIFQSVGGLRQVPDFSQAFGTYHSSCPFGNATTMHIGTSLYLFEEKNIRVLCQNLPDKASVLVEFSGKIYAYTDARIFEVDTSGTCKEDFPTAPLYAENCFGSTGNGSPVKDFSPNLVAPVVAVTYAEPSKEPLKPIYRFPRDRDATRPIQIYFEDKLLSPSEYRMTDTYFELVSVHQTIANTVKLCYYTTKPECDISKTLKNCSCGVSFGGGGLGGTRVILSGNHDFPGTYFMSELANPLCFYEKNKGVMDKGIGSVTGFSQQGQELLMFTTSSVQVMRYHFSADTGGYFTVHCVHAHLGCDMPGSIALVDNRTVFANSALGVYLVDSVNWTDAFRIVPLSQNICSKSGEKGFNAVPIAARKQADCCIFDRKYLLLAGESVFVWDFGKRRYSASSNPEKSEKALVWSELCLGKGTHLVSDGFDVYVLEQTDSCVNISVLDKQSPMTDHGFVLQSGQLDFGIPHFQKTVKELMFSCKSKAPCTLLVGACGDGTAFYQKRLQVVPNNNGCATVKVKLPSYRCERFLFSVQGDQGGVGFFNFRINFIVSKQNLKD